MFLPFLCKRLLWDIPTGKSHTWIIVIQNQIDLVLNKHTLRAIDSYFQKRLQCCVRWNGQNEDMLIFYSQLEKMANFFDYLFINKKIFDKK